MRLHSVYALALVVVVCVAGCVVPASRYNRLHAESQALGEKLQAREAELANLRKHAERLALELYMTEQRLADLESGTPNRTGLRNTSSKR